MMTESHLNLMHSLITARGQVRGVTYCNGTIRINHRYGKRFVSGSVSGSSRDAYKAALLKLGAGVGLPAVGVECLVKRTYSNFLAHYGLSVK